MGRGNQDGRRFQAFGSLVAVALLVLAGRLWQLQVARGDVYAELARENRVQVLRVPAPRGRILDREGRLLAGNRYAFALSVVPEELPRGEGVLERLAVLSGADPARLAQQVARAQASRPPYQAAQLLADIPPEVVVRVEEARPGLPGVLVEEKPVRHYPLGAAAGHVLGYVGRISREELSALAAAGYRGDAWTGKVGLERTYERWLRGREGGRWIEVNALGLPVRQLGEEPAREGADLILTLDSRLQVAAEEALNRQLEVLRQERGLEPGGGAVVVLDPRDGAVRALASAPGFDPNRFVGGVAAGYFTGLQAPPSALLNRAVQGQYPPGSAFKPFTAAAALDLGLASRDEVFYADDLGPFGKKDWTLHAGLPPHGRVNLLTAMAYSCNDYFWELGQRIGGERLAAYARRFGFGKPTGLVLDPPEKAGLVPDAAWKRHAFSGGPAWAQLWYPAETLDFAIGQGYLTVTPLQLAVAYAALANGGILYRPYLVQEIRSPDGETLFRAKPEVAGRVGLAEETLRAVRDSLVAVTEHRGTAYQGTAQPAFAGFPVRVAGKTGTAQVAGAPAHGWFAAFAPAEAPEVVVVVLLEHGGSGAASAAPVARRILAAYFGIGEGQ